jgi:hypothetical protein
MVSRIQIGMPSVTGEFLDEVKQDPSAIDAGRGERIKVGDLSKDRSVIGDDAFVERSDRLNTG